MFFFVILSLLFTYIKQNKWFLFFLNYILIILVDLFIMIYFLLPGSRSAFPEVDPDPAKWYGSNRIRILNTAYLIGWSGQRCMHCGIHQGSQPIFLLPIPTIHHGLSKSVYWPVDDGDPVPDLLVPHDDDEGDEQQVQVTYLQTNRLPTYKQTGYLLTNKQVTYLQTNRLPTYKQADYLLTKKQVTYLLTNRLHTYKQAEITYLQTNRLPTY